MEEQRPQQQRRGGARPQQRPGPPGSRLVSRRSPAAPGTLSQRARESASTAGMRPSASRPSVISPATSPPSPSARSGRVASAPVAWSERTVTAAAVPVANGQLLAIHELPLERHGEQHSQRGQQKRPRQQRPPRGMVTDGDQVCALGGHQPPSCRVPRRRGHRLRAARLQRGQRRPSHPRRQTTQVPWVAYASSPAVTATPKASPTFNPRIEVGGAGDDAQGTAQQHRPRGELRQPIPWYTSRSHVSPRPPGCLRGPVSRSVAADERGNVGFRRGQAGP